MDLQQLVSQAEQEISERKAQLEARERELNLKDMDIEKKGKEVWVREASVAKLLEKNQQILAKISQLESVKRSDMEISERIIKAEEKEKEAAKILLAAQTKALEAEILMGQANKRKAEVSKEAAEFKAKLVDSLKEAIKNA